MMNGTGTLILRWGQTEVSTLNIHVVLKLMFKRRLELPLPGSDSFFLWGPRQTGKSTLLRQAYPDALWTAGVTTSAAQLLRPALAANASSCAVT